VRSILFVLLLLATGALVPQEGSGQESSFAYQIRAGRFLPMGHLRDDEAGWEKGARGGWSMGMGFTFPFLGPLGSYLGFSQSRFTCDHAVCPSGKSWETTGFDVALRYVVGRQSRIRPWFQLGLHTHRLSSVVKGEEGQARELHSQGGGAYEFGLGLLVQVGERSSFGPGIRYGHGEAPYAGRSAMRLRYLVMDLGLVVGF
jgi:hypothetical protein